MSAPLAVQRLRLIGYFYGHEVVSCDDVSLVRAQAEAFLKFWTVHAACPTRSRMIHVQLSLVNQCDLRDI
jgi:hypothetical protein